MTVTALPDPMAAIAARVGAIQARFGVSRSQSTTAASATDFDALLDDLLGEDGVRTASDVLNSLGLGAGTGSSALGSSGRAGSSGGLGGLGSGGMGALLGGLGQAGGPGQPAAGLAATLRSSGVLSGFGGMGGAGTASLASLFGQFEGLSANSGARSVTGAQVVRTAAEHLGTPYVWGGEQPGGFDCSGLVQYSYNKLGIKLPRTAAEQAAVGRPVASLADARPGDLIAFHSPVDHIGIYAGHGQMVVAPKTGDVVKIQRISTPPTAIRRILPDAAAGAAAPVPAAAVLAPVLAATPSAPMPAAGDSPSTPTATGDV